MPTASSDAFGVPRHPDGLPAPGLPGTVTEEVFDRLAGLVGRLLGVPVALVTLAGEEGQELVGAQGLDRPEAAAWEALRRQAVRLDAPLVVEDAREDPHLRDLGAVACLGVPVHGPDGCPVGALVAIGGEARSWTDEDLAAVQDLAAVAGVSMARRASPRASAARAEAEEASVEAVHLAAQLLDSIHDAFFSLDHDERFTYVNAQAEELLARPREELIGRRICDVFSGPDDAFFLAHYRRAAETGEVASFEAYYSPRRIHLAVRVYPFEGGLSVYFRDVHAQKEAEAALREMNALLERGVQERTSALEQANRALTQRNRELQDFAYIASHDLREPLRKVSAFANLLISDYADVLDGEGRFYLERMQNATKRMSRLINDLLDFSRILTRGKPFERVDLNEIARRVCSDLQVSIQETSGQVHYDGLPTIDADPTQMYQLLLNLVGNALKFHREGVPPVVRLHVEPAGREGVCRLAITDNGIGFDEKYAERIFTPFQRLHGLDVYEGTGIGLAICRRIAERHGGTMAARSTPGQGSTFVVALPLRQPLPAAEATDGDAAWVGPR